MPRQVPPLTDPGIKNAKADSKPFKLADGGGLYVLVMPTRQLTPAVEARILARTQAAPTDGSTHWSTRKLAKVLGTHHVMIARVWTKHSLRPRRLDR